MDTEMDSAEATLKFFKQQLLGDDNAYTLDVPDCKIKLNQNENPWDWPAHLKQAVFEEVRDLEWNRYPAFIPTAFLEQLASFLGVDANQVLVGNGSNELLYAIFVATLEPGRKVVIPQPTFTVYKLLADLMGAEIDTSGFDDELQFDVQALERASADAAVVVLTTPNNPTGAVIDPTDLEHLVNTSQALWVIDEAYFEFHGETAIELTRNYRNIVVLRTFSKAFATAGLRIGYLVGHPDTVAVLDKAKLPYNMGHFSLAAARVAMDNAVSLRGRVEEIKRERKRLVRELSSRNGIKVHPTCANFILFETGCEPKIIWRHMVTQGVLIRDVSKYPRLEAALRVTVGRPNENDAFLAAFDAAMTSQPETI
ncbi:histidinol-phosphate transaminase [Planctomycetota bacterium]|nr:histidinol-phosphate transaminase [Planctomycetota bacterium]